MKKIFIAFIFSIFLVLSSIHIVTAQVQTSTAGCKIPENVSAENMTQFFEQCQSKGVSAKPASGKKDIDGIRDQVQKISAQALTYAGLFAVGALVFAGILYTTAYGDSSRLEKAKKTAIFACIGLFVALASYSLVNAVLYFLFQL